MSKILNQIHGHFNMKYFRIGYCPPNPGPWSRKYRHVRAFSENEIDHAIKYAQENSKEPIYMKANYGARYNEITFSKLCEYAK